MTLHCARPERRADVRAGRVNGLDAVEVDDDGVTLHLSFLGKAPDRLEPHNVRIEGGRRVVGVHAVDVTIEREEDPELDDGATVVVDRPGDTSVYRLTLVEPDAFGRPGPTVLAGFDPRYAGADLRFRPQCPDDTDCRPECPPGPARAQAPVIDYTVRDYATFRRALLDRMALTVPSWTERHVPDIGVMLVELLAYVGDQLEYQLDTVATESYLGSARERVSVRRHARLIDYRMHDGCNARTFVTVEVDGTVELPAGRYRFASVDVSRVDARVRPVLGPVLADDELARLPAAAHHETFEPMHEAAPLREAHNVIRFYTWGDAECCIPAGATSAVLVDAYVGDADARQAGPPAGEPVEPERALQLQAGDVLIVEEVTGPRTGVAADADPDHRQAVRLTSVTRIEDPLYDQPLVEVTWDVDDALTFDVCISAVGGPDCALIEDVTVLRGNVLLVDHGRSRTFCGGAPEIFEVPHAPPPRLDCDAGPGCGDRPARGPVGDRIAQLLVEAGRGRQLTEDQVIALRGLVGHAALDRVGLDHTATAAEQGTSLQILLAQLTYPAVSTPFRPRLARHPVTQAAAHPDPSRVAAGQAALLTAVPALAHDRVDELRRAVLGGKRLTSEELGELRALVGARVLDELDVIARPGPGLRDLLLRWDGLMAAKIRRARRLAERAGGGEEMGPWLAWEIGQTWGNRYADGLDPAGPRLAGPAASTLRQDPRGTLPAVAVHGIDADGRDAGTWYPARDLLDAGPGDRLVVGETTASDELVLRFGDGVQGMPPPPGSLRVAYRVGNGAAGNVGAESIGHLLLCADARVDGVRRVRNPLAAVGGVDPEPMEVVRRQAPLALRAERLRAVTAEDYAELAGQVPGVARAAATVRWSGAGSEVHVAVDVRAGHVPARVLAAVERRLREVRRIGHDLVVGPARLVPVDLALRVCAAPGHVRGALRTALRRALGPRQGAGGAPGLFHPDLLSFGDPVRVSRVVATAAAVPGVASVTVTRLRRLFEPDQAELEEGLLRLGPLEIAQLDDDADRPEHGRLLIEIGGGR